MTQRHNGGQGLVEYALIIALIAIVTIASLSGVGSQIITQLQSITNAL